MSLRPHRPEPQPSHAASSVDRNSSPRRAAMRLRAGEQLILTDTYSTGLAIMAQLRALLPAPADDAGYQARRSFRHSFGAASQRLLAPVVDHHLALAEAPAIGFLQQLYPELSRFALSFADAQDLYSAWIWYTKGAHLAVLGYRVYPFYGTYVPTRVTHLELFATWLSQYQGPRTRAVDVGTGCGVLALMLCKAGFERVLATDDNPNAIISVQRQLARLPSPLPVDLEHGDLLGADPAPAELIVFNPPWTQGEVETLLDGALYYEPGLFERFFDQALARLTPTGRVVLLFSSLISLVQPDTPHPILTELERGRFTLVQKLQRKVRASDTPGAGPRRKTRERVEIWELIPA